MAGLCCCGTDFLAPGTAGASDASSRRGGLFRPGARYARIRRLRQTIRDPRYEARALAEEFRVLAKLIEFGSGQKLSLASHDMDAHPAMLWAADHPNEIACLVYMEVPTMLEEFLTKVIVYTPKEMAKGCMWWWILPLAPDVPERLIVGHERAFLTWFFEGATADPASITEASIEEALRSFRGAQLCELPVHDVARRRRLITSSQLLCRAKLRDHLANRLGAFGMVPKLLTLPSGSATATAIVSAWRSKRKNRTFAFMTASLPLLALNCVS